MLVLKIETWSNLDSFYNHEFPTTLFIEGRKLKHKRHTRKNVDTDKAENIDVFSERVYEELEIAEVDQYNNLDTSQNAISFSYFDDKGEYKAIVIYSPARVYVLQSGKTIDKFIA